MTGLPWLWLIVHWSPLVRTGNVFLVESIVIKVSVCFCLCQEVEVGGGESWIFTRPREGSAPPPPTLNFVALVWLWPVVHVDVI